VFSAIALALLSSFAYGAADFSGGLAARGAHVLRVLVVSTRQAPSSPSWRGRWPTRTSSSPRGGFTELATLLLPARSNHLGGRRETAGVAGDRAVTINLKSPPPRLMPPDTASHTGAGGGDALDNK
jgi:hypothetical protein